MVIGRNYFLSEKYKTTLLTTKRKVCHCLSNLGSSSFLSLTRLWIKERQYNKKYHHIFRNEPTNHYIKLLQCFHSWNIYVLPRPSIKGFSWGIMWHIYLPRACMSLWWFDSYMPCHLLTAAFQRKETHFKQQHYITEC